MKGGFLSLQTSLTSLNFPARLPPNMAEAVPGSFCVLGGKICFGVRLSHLIGGIYDRRLNKFLFGKIDNAFLLLQRISHGLPSTACLMFYIKHTIVGTIYKVMVSDLYCRFRVSTC